MNDKQRFGYFRRWKAVVQAHGLDKLPKDQQDEERHAITLEATRGRTSSITDITDQKEITRLFRLLEFKAHKNDDLNSALPVANPEMEEEADEQRRAVVALSNKGLMLDEIARIAAPLCRRHRVGTWQKLPSTVLKDMTRWKQFQPAEIERRRRVAALPLEQTTRKDDVVIYHLRPSPPTPKPVTAGPY